MARLLCLSLIVFLSFPLFGQDESIPPGLNVPQDPALLMRMREDITLQLQDIQRILGFVNVNDTRTVETLQTRQAELTQQLREVMQQIHNTTSLGHSPGQSLGRETGMMPPGFPAPIDTQWMPGMGMPGIPIPPVPSMPNTMPVPNAGWATVQGTPQDAALMRELTEVKQTVGTLRREIGELKETIRTLEAQIQLLNRNILLNDRVRDDVSGGR